MKRIIFEKLTVKKKKMVFAGMISSGIPINSEVCDDPSKVNGDYCLIVPLNPGSECVQLGDDDGQQG